MMRSVSRIAIGAFALTLAMPAAAQEIGTRLGPSGRPVTVAGKGMTASDRTRLVIIDFSTCVLTRDRKRAVAALDMFPGREGLEALRKLSGSRCMESGELQFDLMLFRGGLFTALYRERFGAGLPVLGEANFREGAPDVLDDVAAQSIGLREFGECVVKRDPALMHRIVMARVASDEEDAAYRDLAPHLGPCLTEGQQVKFSKTVLSGLLAEVLYRDAVAGAAPAAGKD